MFIKQVSIFLENKAGTMKELTELLGRSGVDMLALSVADTQSFGIVRIIIGSEQIDPALKLLRENGYIAKVNNVICAEVADRPMGLSEVLAVIDEAGLSVEYMYSFLRGTANGQAHMILRLSDGERGVKLFQMHEVRMLSQEDVDNM